MTQSFTGATFDSGDWSTGVIALGTFTGTSLTGLANIASVTFTGTLTTPGVLTGATLTLNLVNGSNSGLAVTGLDYVGYAPATDGSGDPTYFISADVAGIATPVTFAITTDPKTPLSFLSILTGVDTNGATTAPPSTNPNPPCFVSGTLIATTRGEVAVEDLKVGDQVVTASGVARPITWLGRKRVAQPPADQQPVRVLAGAFDEGLPARDLFLSPGHAVCVDVMGEVFTPVGRLINGATVAQIEVAEVTYWHVELESHDVLLAEGMPCESFMDAGNRAFFGREYGRLEAVDPERVTASLAHYARPFVDQGPLVESIRLRLDARAEAMGWTRDADLDLHLLVDGRRIEPTIEGDLARFVLPADADDARLVSKTFIPGRDRRSLGIRVGAIGVSDGLRVNREVPLDVLSEGAYGLERDQQQRPWRWTNGDTLLPASLWAGCNGVAMLTLAFRPGLGKVWVAPQVTPAASSARAA